MRSSGWATRGAVVPDQPAKTLAALASLRPPTGPLVLRLNRFFWSDGEAGIQELAGNATLLYYMSEEAQEGRNAYVEKRRPDFGKFKRVP